MRLAISKKLSSESMKRYWSADTLFLQLSTDYNMDGHMNVQYQAAGSQSS